MYEKMQLLPLFQGLNLNDFSDILSTLKLDFEQYSEGDAIICQGDAMQRLTYIIDGDFEIEYRCLHPNMILTEICSNTPYIIEPYNLFSVKRTSERTYTFRSKGATFSIDRRVFTNKILKHPLVKSNMINYTCNMLRKICDERNEMVSLTIDQKILHLVTQMCKIPNGRKRIKIKMEELADCIQETRLNVSKTLNQWNDTGFISLGRSGWEIIDLNKTTKTQATTPNGL